MPLHLAIAWLKIYAPIGRLDAGLVIFLLVWCAAVLGGFAVWLLRDRGEHPEP